MLDSSSPPVPPRRLDGWKEIAAHLGRSVRTAQRWEADLGLPVHRLQTGGAETVWALAPEIDAWRIRAASAPAPAGPPDAESPVSTGAPAGTPPPTDAAPLMRRTLPIAGAVCLALALTALGAWAAFTLTSRTSRQAHVGASDVVPNPVRGVVTGGVLRVFGDRGQLLWQKDGRDFGVRLTDEYHAPRPDGNDAVAVHDLDEDGLAEVLIAPEPRNLTASGVFCFNHDGSLRFRHQPDYRVRYEHLACVPPWRTMFFKITGRPGRPHDIWVVSSHLQEFPTVVERLDAKGRPSSQYWSNGLVSFVGTAELGGSPVVLVGACSNEFKGATLAVLDGRHPTATAPAENPHYACSGCPGRAPLAFLVFPRLDVAVVTEDHSTLDHAQADSSGQLLLRIFHSADGIAPNSDTRAVSASDYVLGPGFRVVKAEIGERYPAVHRRGEIAGLLDHPFSRARDERYLWPVRRWTGDRFELVHGLER